MNMIIQAAHFAAEAHLGQFRKFTSHVAYVNHPIAVAKIAAEAIEPDHQAFDDMIAAALLHDTVEDTDVTIETIEQLFGCNVAILVASLTSVSKREDGNRAARKAKDLAHLAKASPAAKTIKLADILDNVATLVDRDREFASIYLPEKRLQLNVLGDGHLVLYQKALALVENEISRL